MRALVIGGAGFISGAAVRKLAERGHEVLCFHRGITQGKLPPGVTSLLGDRQRIADHAARLRAFRPDVVIDCVAFHERDAQTLLETFRGATEHLVVLSSMDVYRAWGRFTRAEPGPPDSVLLDEDAPLRETRFPRRSSVTPDDVMWDYEKILVERALAGQACTILRLPMVFGPGDHKRHRVGHYLERMRASSRIELDPAMARWRCSRCYVDDAAEAIVLASMTRDGLPHTYNVSGSVLPEREWVSAIAQAAGWAGTLADRASEGEEDFSQELVLDARRARVELGWEPQAKLDEALAKSIAWERE